MIELRHIGKQFPGVRALHDVSLTIGKGEVLGLVGENGAGKSTLVKILGGVYAAGSFTGEVVVDGKPQAFRSTTDARKAGIVTVHQELCLVPEMTVAENLMLGREPTRFGIVDRVRLQAMARDLLASVLGANHGPGSIDLDVPVGHYGVGVQQMLEIARGLGEHASVIVLDEPTAALTDGEIERLFALVRARRAAGASFIYISHRLEEITALCDRIAVMRDGELVDTLPGSADRDAIVTRMTGKELGDVHARRATARAPGKPVLEVTGLAVSHPSLPARRVVDELSLTVREGEVVALAGAMGAGRTATLSALFGTARSAVRGRIRVDGRDVSIHSPIDAIRCGLAYVPEDRKGAGLVLDLSVHDNLTLAANHARFGVVDHARAEHAALARFRDLAIKAPGLRTEVATLSGGNQQKVVIGKWLELAPRVLLLDEPTRGVDVGAKVEIYRLIEELVGRGHAVLLASSDLPEIVRLADRVLVLREGALVGELAGDAITQLAIMQLAMGMQPATEPAPVFVPPPSPAVGAGVEGVAS